jgi:hypothetical protein
MTDARSYLDQLGAELADRGWKAEVVMDGGHPVLSVCNPDAADVTETIACSGDAYVSRWGRSIGPVADVPAVADRISRVLREVSEWVLGK